MTLAGAPRDGLGTTELGPGPERSRRAEAVGKRNDDGSKPPAGRRKERHQSAAASSQKSSAAHRLFRPKVDRDCSEFVTQTTSVNGTGEKPVRLPATTVIASGRRLQGPLIEKKEVRTCSQWQNEINPSVW